MLNYLKCFCLFSHIWLYLIIRNCYADLPQITGTNFVKIVHLALQDEQTLFS